MLLPAVAVIAAPFERELDLPAATSSHRVTQLVALNPDISYSVLDVEGPGCITHIWMTMGKNDPRGIVLRMYWDGETEPSVEAPLTDFFGVGHNESEPGRYFTTPVLSVAPRNGYNAYFPMPFRGSARIEVRNDQPVPLMDGGGVYFQADYVKYESLSESVPYFHAQWRREAPAARRGKPYTIMEAVGKGFLAGVTHHVRQDDDSDKWFHGGGDYMFIDGPTGPKVIKGIGGEDFFGESWGSADFVSPYAGSTVNRDGKVSMYRFFLEGPIRFNESIRFGIGSLENENTSVGYWYQTKPHQRFFQMPHLALRQPDSTILPGAYDVELMPDAQTTVAVIGPFYGDTNLESPLDGLPRIDTRQGLGTNYLLPYKNVIPEKGASPVTWERARTVLSWLDFDAMFKPKMREVTGVQSMPETVVYVLLTLDASGERKSRMVLGHDDPLRIWLNGALIADLEGPGDFVRFMHDLDLRDGRNDVLLKVSNTWGNNFAANALSMSLEETEGVTVYSFSELPAVPGHAK